MNKKEQKTDKQPDEPVGGGEQVVSPPEFLNVCITERVDTADRMGRA